MENINSSQELFLNIRKSIRLLYEYQKRMQGTMFSTAVLIYLRQEELKSINCSLVRPVPAKIMGRLSSLTGIGRGIISIPWLWSIISVRGN